MIKNSLNSCIQLHSQEQSYPQLTAIPGIEVTSEESPDLYKNMTLYKLKEARLTYLLTWKRQDCLNDRTL